MVEFDDGTSFPRVTFCRRRTECVSDRRGLFVVSTGFGTSFYCRDSRRNGSKGVWDRI